MIIVPECPEVPVQASFVEHDEVTGPMVLRISSMADSSTTRSLPVFI
jgi:hypothetical protein